MPPQTYEPWNGFSSAQQNSAPQSSAQQNSAPQSSTSHNYAPQPPRQQPSSNVTNQQEVQSRPQVAYAAPVQKKTHGWIVAIVVIVCLFAFMALCVNECSHLFSSLTANNMGTDNAPANSVAKIDIDGTIQYDGTACSPAGLKVLLDEAADNENIKAVVLRVNSGGGTATAGEEMATYLREFKEDSDKPVVVSSASLNASAAYEISSQADYIFVAKSTEIGAIGTVMQQTDLSGLMDMLGIKMEVIASADSKDSSYGYRPLTTEEREYYQRMIDQINDLFIEKVAEGRKMTTEEVRQLATGLVFTGVDAVQNGLADEIGTLEDAEEKAARLAGLGENFETYDLGFSSHDFSSIYDLLGLTEGESQRFLPLLKQ